MSKARASLGLEASYKKSTQTLTLDNRVFKVCDIKEERLGLVRRKILFLHFDGNTWNILLCNEGFTDIKHYKLR
jgi:hypothetical protein